MKSLINLRWIFTHMIEEYARHNGHADLLREAIDGATGDQRSRISPSTRRIAGNDFAQDGAVAGVAPS